VYLCGVHGHGFNCDIFKPGGLHKKHAVATWYVETISAFAIRKKQRRKLLLIWPIARLSGYMQPSTQHCDKQKQIGSIHSISKTQNAADADALGTGLRRTRLIMSALVTSGRGL
jgi:hypothetical protein